VEEHCCTKERVGHISQIHNGQWHFKALLAAKPHQKHVSNIDNFVWRFCVNYIPLNQITRQTAYPIPGCDNTVTLAFGMALYFWLFDATINYNQLSVSPKSQEKLVFQGTDAIKWTCAVMPFGPTNGPATFIQDLDSAWKDLASRSGVVVDNDTNTNIIVDNIFNWATSFDKTLQYLEGQLQICKVYRLTLSIKKSHFFLKCFEFVGINILQEGNCLAMSKHQLLERWPTPEYVRDVANFMGFLHFYSAFIPFFEVCVEPFCKIMKHKYSSCVGNLWDSTTATAFKKLLHCILHNPCLCHFDHTKLTIL
jgi:hypothetical protein